MGSRGHSVNDSNPVDRTLACPLLTPPPPAQTRLTRENASGLSPLSPYPALPTTERPPTRISTESRLRQITLSSPHYVQAAGRCVDKGIVLRWVAAETVLPRADGWE